MGGRRPLPIYSHNACEICNHEIKRTLLTCAVGNRHHVASIV